MSRQTHPNPVLGLALAADVMTEVWLVATEEGVGEAQRAGGQQRPKSCTLLCPAPLEAVKPPPEVRNAGQPWKHPHVKLAHKAANIASVGDGSHRCMVSSDPGEQVHLHCVRTAVSKCLTGCLPGACRGSLH